MTMTEERSVTMHIDAKNMSAQELDEFFNPVKQHMEIDAGFVDDSHFSSPMRGALIATPISLAMWAVIIWALSKLF
jgi:hypothetical protein